ncbi:hypothetical protein MMPV_006228 [Pyropia vietnamensis]
MAANGGAPPSPSSAPALPVGSSGLPTPPPRPEPAPRLTEAEAAAWRPGRPNILLTGTPGTGKSTTAAAVAAAVGLTHLDVGAYAAARAAWAYDGWDAARGCHLLNEDAVADGLEASMTTGGIVLDYHSVDWLPLRWVQLVVVLRAHTESLYDRLTARGYADAKRRENVEAEVHQVVLDEAIDAFPDTPRLVLWADLPSSLSRNVAAIAAAYAALPGSGTAGDGASPTATRTATTTPI